jgi:hypothetical protein
VLIQKNIYGVNRARPVTCNQTTEGKQCRYVLGVMRYHVIRYRPGPAGSSILKPADVDGLRKVRFIWIGQCRRRIGSTAEIKTYGYGCVGTICGLMHDGKSCMAAAMAHRSGGATTFAVAMSSPSPSMSLRTVKTAQITSPNQTVPIIYGCRMLFFFSVRA